MGIWTDGIKRSSGEDEREEDITLPGIRAHNTTRLGNKCTFYEEQLDLIDDILAKGDEAFHVCPPESEEYSLGKKLHEKIPVYLIPYEEYLVEMKSRCESDFAVKMRQLYKKEIERIPQECNREERERREARIKVKYSPWLPGTCPGSCKDCVAVLGTPLGYFKPDANDGEKWGIFICYDRIKKIYPAEKVDSITVKVLLHELGHAIMYNESHPKYETCFEYWAEESLANKIALNYLAVASKDLGRPDLYSPAEAMVSCQKEPYRFGLYLHGHNASDWASLRDGKTNISGVFADRWVDAVCDWCLGYRTVGFAELQRLFFRALDGSAMTAAAASGFDSWLISLGKSSSTVKRYQAFVTSPYIGLVFKEMVGWGYDTVADCKSSTEIQMLIDSIAMTDSGFSYASFGATSSLGSYREYLLSLGL